MTDDPIHGDAPPLNSPHCHECGAPLDPSQRYCLNCGAPTSKAPRMATGKGARVLALSLVLLALGTGFLAVAVSQQSGKTTTATSTSGTGTGGFPTDTSGTGTGFNTVTSGTGTTPTDTTTTPTDTTTTPTDTTKTTPTDTTKTTPTDTGSGAAAPASWPAGTSAWTVVLASATSQSSANQIAARASADGLQAGVLYSGAYPTLTPGYWVVFSGTYATSAEAQAAASNAQSSFPGAAARYVASGS